MAEGPLMLLRNKNPTPKVIYALQEVRLAWGLSVQDIADRVGTSPRHLRDCEFGKHKPNTELLEAWADALGYEITLKAK